jgi:putative hydrolase of HD superfamily
VTIDSDRLQKQLAFIYEIDKLKSVYRRTYLLTGERNENSAEHSWQVAIMVNVLAEYAKEPIDVSRVMHMILLHDIVEIDSGDVFVYDQAGMAEKPAKEKLAADRIFGLLPSDKASEYKALWEEFEAVETADARFAAALDRLMPVLHNIYGNKSTWKEHGVTLEQVIARNEHIEDGSPELWEYAQKLIRQEFEKN